MGQKSSWQKVLYQKLGNQWFLFTEVNGEMKYSVLPPGIHPHFLKRQLFSVQKQTNRKNSLYIQTNSNKSL